MQPIEVLKEEYSIHLQKGIPFRASLGKLPAGKFSYRFYIYNPSGVNGNLSASVSGQKKEAVQQTFVFKDLVTECSYNFNTTDHFDHIQIEFLTSGNEAVFLHLPINPVIVQDTEMLPPFLFGLDEKIAGLIDEKEGVDSSRSFGPQPMAEAFAARSGGSVNMREVEAFIRGRYFKGFLSLEDAERQLDYVVLQKMFDTSSDSGFVKFKKKLYGKVLRTIYRLLTRNRSRKLYLAKIYGNYVNTGILAENVQ